MKHTNSDLVFHYCSVDTLISIIMNSTLRLSDLDKTNDNMERKWLLSKIKPGIIEIFENRNLGFYEQQELTKILNETFSGDRLHMMGFPFNPMYITCFSQDSDLLSQWRGYGQDGKGVAIGFRKEYFRNLCLAQVLNFDRVNYGESEVVELILNDIKNTCSSSSVVELSSQLFFISQEIINDKYSMILPFHKNPAFAEEHEWRLTFCPSLLKFNGKYSQYVYEKYNNFLSSQISDIGFRSDGTKIISYYDLNLNGAQKPIQEIVIGPSSDLSPYDLFPLLEKHGFLDVMISHSEASYVNKT